MIGGKSLLVDALKAGVAGMALIVAGVSPSVAMAQNATSYQIASQPLPQALMQLSRQANVDISASAKLTRGKVAGAVSGAGSVEAALAQMLSGTGLSYRKAGKGFAIIAGAKGGNGERPQAPVVDSQIGYGVGGGAVVDARTGAPLKGALVQIVSTGEKAATDDLGQYRFPGKTGSFDIRVSYLGYLPFEQKVDLKDGRAATAVYLSDGSKVGEIVVYGTRSARATALNQERTNDNVSSIFSSDQMGRFGGATISESLRRAPGVSFDRSGETGDGTNIVVRGMAPDFNAIKLNGVELPEGKGRGRSASLSNVLTESVGQVTINKTLMASQDSSGTGGLIEIETKSPLERNRRFASFSIEGGGRAKGFGDEFQASGTLSGRFGPGDNFGLSASFQIRKRSIRSVSTSVGYPNAGQYLPAYPNGQPIPSPQHVDPFDVFPFEGGGETLYPISTNLREGKTKTTNRAYNIAAAWQIAPNSLLKFDISRFEQVDTNFSRSTSLGATTSYQLTPVQELGGEPRYRLAWGPDRFINLSQNYSYSPDEKTITNVVAASGNTSLGRLDLRYSGGFTKGSSSRPATELSFGDFVSIPENYLLASAVDSVEGGVLSPFSPTADDPTIPLFNEAGLSFLGSPASYRLQSMGKNIVSGQNRRWVADINGRYTLPSKWLNYLEAGISWKRSRFANRTGDPLQYYPIADPLDGYQNPRLSQFGLTFGSSPLERLDRGSALSLISFEDMVRFMETGLPKIASVYDPSNPSTFNPPNLAYARSIVLDPLLRQQYTRETELAGYLQGKVTLGALEVIGGVRVNRTDVVARQLRAPIYIRADFTFDPEFEGRFNGLNTETSRRTDVLPRILANWRIDKDNIIRAGYYSTVARPSINDISKSPQISLYMFPFFGPQNDKPWLSVTKGNPDLKPSVTHNFDVSFEHYDSRVGVVKIGAFYKRITNLLENNFTNDNSEVLAAAGVLPHFPAFNNVLQNPENYHLSVSVPFNNDSPASIWGFETSFERQLKFLPGWLSGFGVYANYTYTKSKKQQPFNWNYSPIIDSSGTVAGYESTQVIFRNVSFQGQPKHSGTISLTYNAAGFDGMAAYSFQSSRRGINFLANGFINGEKSYRTLDARLSYTFGKMSGKPRIFIEGSDLLRSSNDPSFSLPIFTSTGEEYDSQETYFGGRKLRLGLGITF
ncbi:TonB-dependent receptor [Sphingomonas colocasiae]|uniref:TonB-dependent receptor n=1 Tax=Sphingomonas colocasiae TaxID=1848973 RepID=A0ABS7PPI9_9SPHN|nr:TonB-dependent receptor [Sphingomonas colocasiae]MBY8823235.1 TonB-dependent receptor [Sphingomonas colocasiae]